LKEGATPEAIKDKDKDSNQEEAISNLHATIKGLYK